MNGSLRIVVCLALCPALGAQSSERVSVDSFGAQANGASVDGHISADGRFVVFESQATNLVPGDTNGKQDIFVHDCASGTTERVSVASSGAEGDENANGCALSGDGRFVAFSSDATNLVPGDTNGLRDVFVRDRLLGTTIAVSVDASGVPGNASSGWPAVSGDGRFVAFVSDCSNLVPGDTNGTADVFVRDLMLGTTERASLGSGGVQANGGAESVAISSDGRFVAFGSVATNLVAGDTNGIGDIFLRDRLNGMTERVNLGIAGAQADAFSSEPALSDDGRFVAFTSTATNLVAGDTNAVLDVFVRDRAFGTTRRVSVASDGTQANAYSHEVAISGDGRFVGFESAATNLVSADHNGHVDVFVRDQSFGLTSCLSLGASGAPANSDSAAASLSRDGSRACFSSIASDIVAADTNGLYDVFVREWQTIPGMDLCQPGVGGVSACPCGNPPANAPRGCDNSAGTGGARLSSSGSALLSQESLLFTTQGERPSATSILVQGTSEVSGGLTFGQGVRCVAGSLRRLYVRTASNGSISVPGPGDPTVSARSAALGDTLLAGMQRWYAVYYRDPLVLGGCPSTSTYNITQTQLVSWGN
jgi:hypothetical protein